MVEWLGGSSENTVQFSVLTSIPKKTKFLLQLQSCTTTRLQQFTDKERASLLCCNYVSSISNAAKPAYRLSVDALSQTTSALSVLPSAVWPQHLSASAAAPRRSLSGRPSRIRSWRFIFVAQLTTSSIPWRFTQGHYPDRQIDSHLTSWQSRSPLHVYSVAGQTFATPARLLSTQPFSINLEPALNRGAFLWCIN